MSKERQEQNRLVQIGMERAKLSVYAFIAVSERRYAVIERNSRSVDMKLSDNPVGVNRYVFVEGCERLPWEQANDKLTKLLRAEINVREEMKRLTAPALEEEVKHIKLPAPILKLIVCQEASTLSRATYIPCARPAVALVSNRDRCMYFMCAMCESHNVANRGGILIARLEEGTFRG
jgi:hypothetical protein